MTTTTDIALLCAALDAGDDTALAPLSDALEEAGDARAAGLRIPGVGFATWDHAIDAMPLPGKVMYSYANHWWLAWRPGCERCFPGRGISKHPARSAAFLALAEALS